MDYSIELNIEALIFASDQGLSLEDIQQVMFQTYPGLELKENDIKAYLDKIKKKYKQKEYILELKKTSGQYQFLTKSIFHPVIHNLQSHKDKRRLSQAALETLSIVAYRQPVTKVEIEEIRGVNCDYTVQRLLERNLIEIIGKSEAIGKPLLYGTSSFFLNYFGLSHNNELPKMEDIVEKSDPMDTL